MLISSTGQAFASLGRYGPILPVLPLVGETAMPMLAAIAQGILPMLAFLLTPASFFTAGLFPREDAIHLRLAVAMVAWAGLGVRLLTACGLILAHFGTDTRSGIVLSVLASPVVARLYHCWPPVVSFIGRRARLVVKLRTV